MTTERLHPETLQEQLDREAGVAKSVLEEIERRRSQAEQEGRSFTALTEEHLLRKLRSGKSPIIIWQTWNECTPGSIVYYSVGFTNPDPWIATYLFAHVFVGPASIASDIGVAALAVDTRFPRLTLPTFAGGMTLKPVASTSLDFQLTVPLGVEKTAYLGNVVLFQANWNDRATYLDRGMFIFPVI
jgi:hypothetical protein